MSDKTGNRMGNRTGNRMRSVLLLPVILCSVIFLSVLSTTAYGFGIAPGHKDIPYEAGRTANLKLKLLNNDGAAMKVLLYAEGELEGSVWFDNPVAEFSEGETEKVIDYHVDMPATVDKKGSIETFIIARPIPEEEEGITRVIGVVAPRLVLRVQVPLTGKYAKARLAVPPFKHNQSANFAIEVTNLGTEDIISVQAVIDIYGPLNNKLSQAVSNTIILRSKEKAVLEAPWTANLQPGKYKAVATVIYDGLNVVDEKEFSIGEFRITIDSISVNNFVLGGIAKFEMLLSNNWNLGVDELYADVEVRDPGGRVYAASKTATTSIPAFGKGRLEAFWNTEAVSAGNYRLGISLHYAGLTTQEDFDIFVDTNSITPNLAGRAIQTGKPAGEGEGGLMLKRTVYVLIILVAALLGFNAYIYFRRLRKPPKPPPASPARLRVTQPQQQQQQPPQSEQP